MSYETKKHSATSACWGTAAAAKTSLAESMLFTTGAIDRQG